MMGIALRMAERSIGAAAPNPAVGAVIANPQTGVLIARAATARGGRPHAETQALARAGTVSNGATIYVTLEPCSHHGQTGPCADAIIAGGLARAVVAIEDPDPRVGGRGIDRLRAAGIDVVRGVGADPARWLTRGHIVRITERRPLVTVKMALNGKGGIARGDGVHALFVTGANARAHGHLIRARHDAIMVGAGTVRDDDPELTCRLPGLLDRSPVRIMLSRDMTERVDTQLARTTSKAPLWIFTSDDTSPAARESRQALGVVVQPVQVVGGQLWLPAIMEALVARGITRLLLEGGPTLWRAFADASLVDEIVLYMAPDAVTGPADEARARAALQHWLGVVPVTLIETRHLDPDTMWRFRPVTHMEGH